jgi:hypothetical protein
MRVASLMKRATLSLVVLQILVTAVLPLDNSMAMVAPADDVTTSDSVSGARSADMKTLQSVLENKVVRQRLQDLGFTSEQINSRVNQLSDAQLHQVASQINTLFPGGDDGVIWTIVGVLLIVVLIVILAILL